MSIQLLAPASGGAAYLYHVTPTAAEHFFVGRVRRDSGATYLYCHLCDAVTTIPRTDANADHREIQPLIDAKRITPLIQSDGIPLDPLQAAIADGNIAALPLIPTDTLGRRALCSMLMARHVNQRPAGF